MRRKIARAEMSSVILPRFVRHHAKCHSLWRPRKRREYIGNNKARHCRNAATSNCIANAPEQPQQQLHHGLYRALRSVLTIKPKYTMCPSHTITTAMRPTGTSDITTNPTLSNSVTGMMIDAFVRSVIARFLT